MTTVTTTFKTSVNIKFDLGKREFIDRYLPTPSHAESLLGLLKGFNDPKNNKRSHIIVGPYGTGKSLIATIIGNLTSKRIEDERSLSALRGKFNKVHDDIYRELEKVRELDKTYLTVVLNGNEGRFREALLNAIIRTINENKINIVLPGQYGKILETVSLWESEFPKTYREFKKLLKENDKDLDIWRIAVMNQDKHEVDWFLSVYPLLTSGAKFVIEYNESFTDQISHVLNELNKQGIGLFVAYDEFGRLLQTLESHDIHETMQDLQDLAELTDHYSDSLHVLLITHRNLRQYFSLLSEDFKNEFQRIEKRFKVYYVESDKSTFIRLADHIIQNFRGEIDLDNNTLTTLKGYLRKYPLFPELNQQEIEKIIVEGIYPVHPVALYLLPYLSNNFGQNERTLFTFLESNETGGLLNHLSKSKQYYLASDLFSYFFPNLYDLDTGREDLNVLRIYKSLITKTPQIVENSKGLKLIQLITLWQLAGLQSRIKLDTEFLCFALNVELEIITTILKELSLLKVIRYNRVLGYWELLEGSSFHLEQLVTDHAEHAVLTKRKRLTVLENCLPKHFFFANEYNDQKSITRYATVKLLVSSEIINEELNWKSIREQTKADAIVYYVVLESTNDLASVTEQLKNVEDKLSIFCISQLPFAAIEEQLTEYSVIDMLLENVELLNEDKYLKQELLLRKEDLNFIIDDFLSKYVSYGKDTLWVYNGQIIDVKSEIILENKLSTIMFNAFPHTPEVRNDSFNRRKLNNVQRKAGHAVLDHIINNYREENLGIKGQGPDYLIYATVFKNNKLDITNLDGISQDEFNKLRIALTNHIKQNTTGTLEDFVNIMIESPFGIREPLIPLYFVALLRDKWDQILFYRNDLFVSGINGEKLYKIFDEASEYNYVYYNFDVKYQKFFEVLEENFGYYENEIVRNKPIVIRLNNALLTWLRGLPRITQITNHMSEELVWLKDTIRRSEINPQQTLTQLFIKYGEKIERVVQWKQELENYFDYYKSELEAEIFSTTNTESFEELYTWAGQQRPEVQKQNNLIKSILRCSDSSKWLEQLSYNIVGIEIKNWSDATNELLRNQLKADYKATLEKGESQGEYLQVSYNGKVKTISKVILSTKSETIYKNVERMIKNAGRNVTKDEIEYLVLKLVDKFVE
ncbi:MULTISPECIES: hypothetical protein [Priestia]|uniref:hypothetical protein n=1 Tax=Priestia TaxID=2800373 RepID=UPI0012B71900|nr:hypothetical protein [Priestia megaterium]